MRVEVFSSLPDCAREIREKVFIAEQGFTKEFDDIDKIAVHLVMFDGTVPAAACRIFKDSEQGLYVLGRLAVIKEYRGKQLGFTLLKEVEKYVKGNGGKGIVLLAQLRIKDFYKKAGFEEFGEIEYDEDCPHIRMRKYF